MNENEMKRVIYFEIKVDFTTFLKKISYVIFFVGYFFCKEQVYLCMLILTE